MKLFYSLIFLFAFTAVSHATPILFTFEVEAIGTAGIYYDRRWFDSFTIRAVGDTDNLIYDPSYYSYTIPTTAEFDFGEAGVYPLPNLWGRRRICEVSKSGSNLQFRYSNDEWNTTGVNLGDFTIGHWDMKSSFGPFTGTFDNRQFFDHFLLGGNYYRTEAYIERGLHPITFTARIIPEPSAILLAAGLPLLLARRWNSSATGPGF